MGGERRVEIARALATDPKFMLLDEPFTGVDPIAIGEIQDIVRHLKDKGIGIVITDHNVRETLAITDRAYIMSEGEIKTAGHRPNCPTTPSRASFTSATGSRCEAAMKLIDKQIVRELAGPFAFGVAAFTSVFFAGSYLLKLTTWIMEGMPLGTAVEIVILYLPSVLVYTLPMATLLAVLLGVGRLSGESEMVALFAGGVSLYRVMVPIAWIGVLVTLCSITLNEVIAPRANLKNQTLQAAALKQAGVGDPPFTVVDEGTNSLVRVGGGMDVRTGVLRDVTITQFARMAPKTIWYADRAQWSGVNDAEHRYRWRLISGWCQTLGDSSPAYEAFSDTRTKELEIRKTPDQLSLYQKDPEQMSFAELSQFVEYLRRHPDRTREKIRELDVDRWNKLAFPISSLVFAMLAAPLAIRPQRSASSVGMGLSILVIFIYWMVWRYTSSLAIEGSLAPCVGAFLGDFLGIIAAMALLRRAAK